MGIDRHTYTIKHGGRPEPSTWYGTAEEIKKMVMGTRPERVTAAAGTYEAAVGHFDRMQKTLHSVAKTLADHWSGDSADAAQRALLRLYNTAGELAQASNETGGALRHYGGVVLPKYRAYHWPENGSHADGSTHGGGSNVMPGTSPDAHANKQMRALSERTVQAWDAMPAKLEKDLPGLKPIERDEDPDYTSGGGGGAPPGGHSGGAPYGGYGGGSRDGFGSHLPNPSSPSGGFTEGGGGWSDPSGGFTDGGLPLDDGSHLAGMSPGAGVPGGLPGAGGLGTGGLGSGIGSGLPGTGGSYGVGGAGGALPGGGFGGGRFGSGGLNPEALGRRGIRTNGGRPGGLPGEEPPPVTGRGAGRGVAAREGMPMAPGGAAGRDDAKERERTTWLAEDRDIWTAGIEDYGNGVIGELPRPAPGVTPDAATGEEIVNLDELEEELAQATDRAKESRRKTDTGAGEEAGIHVGEGTSVPDADEADIGDLDSDLVDLFGDDASGQGGT